MRKLKKKWRKQPYLVRIDGDSTGATFVITVPNERIRYEELAPNTMHKLNISIRSTLWKGYCDTEIEVLGYAPKEREVILGFGD